MSDIVEMYFNFEFASQYYTLYTSQKTDFQQAYFNTPLSLFMYIFTWFYWAHKEIQITNDPLYLLNYLPLTTKSITCHSCLGGIPSKNTSFKQTKPLSHHKRKKPGVWRVQIGGRYRGPRREGAESLKCWPNCLQIFRVERTMGFPVYFEGHKASGAQKQEQKGRMIGRSEPLMSTSWCLEHDTRP
jgi:hypothetical protein